MNHTDVTTAIDTTTATVENTGMFGSFGLEGVVQITVSIVVVLILVRTLLIQHHDIRLRQRPWIAGNSNESREQNVLSNGTISCHLINRGPVPAFDVQTKYFCKQTKQEDSEAVFDNTDPVVTDLGPLEEYIFYIAILDGWVDPVTNKGTVYFGIRLSYKDVDKKTKFYEHRGHFIDGFDWTDKIKIS